MWITLKDLWTGTASASLRFSTSIPASLSLSASFPASLNSTELMLTVSMSRWQSPESNSVLRQKTFYDVKMTSSKDIKRRRLTPCLMTLKWLQRRYRWLKILTMRRVKSSSTYVNQFERRSLMFMTFKDSEWRSLIFVTFKTLLMTFKDAFNDV